MSELTNLTCMLMHSCRLTWFSLIEVAEKGHANAKKNPQHKCKSLTMEESPAKDVEETSELPILCLQTELINK